MDESSLLPSLRPIDLTPFHGPDGQSGVILQDLSRIAPQPLALTAAGYFMLTHFDGMHSRVALQRSFQRRFNQALPVQLIEELIATLDDALLLDNPRSREAVRSARKAYADSPVRDNRENWPAADEMRRAIEGTLARGGATPTSGLRAIVAPHLDYARGGPCYADAYATLAAARGFERYVILGVNHYGAGVGVVVTRKDFLTPLGLARTDRDFIERLEARLETDLCGDEFDHAAEHSVELQVQLLQATVDRPFQIVPVLCPSPLDPHDDRPLHALNDFADVLKSLLEDDTNTCIIVGADLSHVGQRFGDETPSEPSLLERIALHDRAVLTCLEHGEPEAFVQELRRMRNPTRICSAGNLYALARAIPGAPLRLLRYHQAVNYEAETHVTCAAGVVAEAT